MQNSTPPQFKLHILEAANLSNPIPLAIQATKDLKQLNNIELRASTGHTKKQTTKIYRKTYTNDITSHYSDSRNFELLIDDTFIIDKEGLTLHNCKNFQIKITSTILNLNNNVKFFITLTDCHSFIIKGLKTTGGRNIITISNSSDFTLSYCKSQNADGYGIIIHNSKQFTIEDCTFQKNRSGIMVVGRSTHAKIKNCNCRDLYGFLNCDAGIHLCATSSSIALEQIPEQCHEALSIEKKTFQPQHIVIENCTLSDCRAQGLYLEGAVNCLIHNNLFSSNNKEGICFDWGSCYNIFTDNIVSLNGRRKALTQDEITVDFLSEYPLLEDGSSSMRLPGISLDNGCMNLIDSNKIITNYGGGIKMIRSSMLNKISNNLIISNAIGRNTFIPFFHGISTLGIGAVNNEFNGERNALLDFSPSVVNTITDNTIEGHWHSIFFDTISKNNFISNNSCSHNATFLNKGTELVKKTISKLKRATWNSLKKNYNLMVRKEITDSKQRTYQ